jgi:subtilisin-like proprotein convertase family protein
MKSKTVLSLALALSSWLAAVSAEASSVTNSFVGTVPNGGDIPDATSPGVYGPPLVVSFNVANLTNSLQSVSLQISMYHQYLGDLDVQLTSPTGTNFVIFSRVGPDIYANGSGNPDILGTSDGFGGYNYGAYTFTDSATNTLRSWSVNTWGANSSSNPGGDPYPIYSGLFRPSSVGPSSDVATTFAASGLVGLSSAQANGTWTLTFRDRSPGNVGNVQSAMLTLVQGSSQLPPPPRFTRIGVTNGLVTLSLTGLVNQAYRIYTTTNLAPPQSWSTNGNSALDGSGKGSYSTSTAGPKCFYRVSTYP